MLDRWRRDGPLPFLGNKHISSTPVIGACERFYDGVSTFGGATSLVIFFVGTPNPTWVGVEYEKSQWSPSDLGI